jgi:putative membrane protein
MKMPRGLARILIHWAVTSISLWVASEIFDGIHFASASALAVSALVLGLANALVRPLLIILTLPLTVLTLGLFLLVINALVLLLVSSLVTGFSIAGFGTAFVASIFIAITSFLINAILNAAMREERADS